MGTEGVLSRELWPRQAPPKFGGEQDENMPPTPRSAAPKPSPRNNNNSNSQQHQPVKTPLRTGSFCFQANAGEHATPGRTTPRRTPLRPRQANTASAAPSPSPSLRISAKTPFRGAADAASTPGRRAGGPVTRPASVSDSQVLDSESDTVKVCIRVRPLNTREMEFGGGHKCTEVRGTRHLVLQAHPEPQVYTFDHVAAENSTQEELFSVAGRPIVSNCMDGYNSCIFAYGQTGSGKTHTMLGCLPESAEERCDPEAGLIVRVFRNLFESISRQEKDKGRDSTKYICKCSMIEIYNEVIYDLLNPMQTQCHIREDIKAGVHMVGQTEEDVYSVIDVVRLLQHGTANRHVGQTKMNRESSRSHCVFSCVIESKVTQDGITNIRHSRLNLVDLAGSERQKSTGAAGDRLREASNINKSLSVLGHVIMSLVEVQHGKQRHIPYRDSRLTFLLQDSLGGNSKTVMIANVSPATSNYGETLSTLRFAQRAKHIRNKAVVNENTTGDSALLRKEIQRLKAELANYQARPQNDVASFMTSPLVGRSSSGAFQMSPLLFGGSPDFGGKSTPENVKTSSDREALKGALRREASAVEDLGKCKEQLREMSNLLSLKDKDHQRFNMIIRLREGKIKRLEESEAGNVPEEVRLLQQELLLWKEKAEHHPEVTRYAMDNLQLKESLAEMRKFTGGERETLLDEVAVLRAKTLELLESEKEMEDVETVAARVAAASAAQIEQAAAHHEQVSAALGVQLEAARGQAEGARAEMDRLREEVWQLRSTLEDKSVELLDAKVAADEAAQSHARIVSGLENELMSEQEANGTLTQEVAALQRALEALRSESNARLEAASAEATASLDELRSQLSQVHFELEDKAMLEVSLSHAEHCANAIQAELDSVLQEIEFQRCEAESRMAEAEAAEKRAGEAESEANAMVERLARLAGVGNDGAANLVAAGDALARVEDRVRQLGEALEVSQHEADMLRAQLDTMVSAEEVESLQNRLDEQEDIVSKICEEVAEYQQELDFLRAESERQHAASAAHAARAAALEGAAAEAAEFKALNDQLSGHMDELVTAMEERNASNKRLREKLAALPDLNEVEALREGLSRAEERAAQLSREVEVATSVADNLRSREAEAADEANRLTNDLAAAKLREEELEELVAALEDENPSATPARGRGEGQLRQRLDHLERELGREQAANEEAHSMLQVKSQQLNQMQDELAAKQSAPDVASAVEWEAEREALRLEIEQQHAAVDEATGELSGMVEVNLQLQEEVAGLKRRAEAAEARESKLESELTKLAGQHNVAQRIHHMQKVKEENALLRAEVVQVREELRRVQHRCQLLLEPQGNHSSVAGGNGRPASTDRQRPGNGSRRTPIVWQPPAVTSSSAEEALGSAEE